VEAKLALIWQQLLGVEGVGIYDNFFELGGHSLLAMRVISVIKKELNVELAVNDIFIHPTIGGLAVKLRGPRKGEVEQPLTNTKYLIPLKDKGRKMPLYIVCGGGGTAFLFKDFAQMLDAEQPVYALQTPVNIKDSDGFPENIEEIASLYIDEILMQNPNGPYALSGHCLGGIVAFEMAKQMEKRGKKIELLAMFEAFAPRALIPEKGKRAPGTFRNLFHIRSLIKKPFFKIPPRLALQIYLFRHHFKVAVKYKFIHLKAIINQTKEKITNSEKSAGLEAFNESEMLFKRASKNYNIQPYDKEILAFYVKEHYYYTDKNNDIIYGRRAFNESANELWKLYARSVKTYMIEGDHSSIFEAKYCENFVKILQQHLNSSDGKLKVREKNVYKKELLNTLP
jgi:thioesterase domain-containing protein